MKSGYILYASLFLVLFLSCLFTPVIPLAVDEPIVVGMSAAFRGPVGGLGTELYRGSMAYFNHINAEGGINGRKILMKAMEDDYNTVQMIGNTIRFIEHENVFLLFNYFGTQTVTRILPLLKAYQNRHIFLLFPFTGAQPHRQPPYQDYVYNLRASYHQETEGLVENLIKVGRKKIGVFYQADAFGRSGWNGVQTTLARHNLKIVGEATYYRGAAYREHMKEQVRILRESGADAVVSICTYTACAAFIRDARDSGWSIPIANLSVAGSEFMVDLLLKSGREKGIDYTQNLIFSQVVPSYEDVSLPAVMQYRKLMEQYNPKLPADLADSSYFPLRYSFVSFEGFLNAKVLVEILKRMGGDMEKTRLPSILNSIRNLDIGIDVPVSFGPGRYQGLDRVYFTTFTGGSFVPLIDWQRVKK